MEEIINTQDSCSSMVDGWVARHTANLTERSGYVRVHYLHPSSDPKFIEQVTGQPYNPLRGTADFSFTLHQLAQEGSVDEEHLKKAIADYYHVRLVHPKYIPSVAEVVLLTRVN